MELELAIWREACRHLEMDDLLGRMLPVLRKWLPVRAVVVRRLDLSRARLDTVAAAGDLPPNLSLRALELTPTQLRVAHSLLSLPTLRFAKLAADEPLWTVAVPNATSGNVLFGALAEEDGPPCALLLFGEAEFTSAQLSQARTILEPFSVALANDRRVHELARLREAAEADRRALLTRLNRQSIVESVVGERDGLRTVMERVEQVAATDVPVLVLGETGSGKEVIARAIHERSGRRTGPMVRVNCGAIPNELIDSELFGHERGSFTGAIAARAGWFERADGGTLLLDEVGELPAAAQVRLLRVLQEGTLERVGGNRTIHVDVRIIAATHRDLHAMVDEGTFREDLWYRISVFPLRLPSLRERRQDIPQLASFFAARAGERLGGGPLVPSSEDLELLLSYPWPGNVRELAAVIERAAILGHGRRLDIAAALGAGARRASSLPPDHGTATRPAALPVGAEAWVSLDVAMAAYIERVLAHTRGRIEGAKGAAALLDINPHTLRARMRKLGVNWSKYR